MHVRQFEAWSAKELTDDELTAEELTDDAQQWLSVRSQQVSCPRRWTGGPDEALTQ